MQSDSHWRRKLQTPPNGFEAQLHQISDSVQFPSVVGSLNPQDPTPKFPAFSAISSALFKFWSNSSHLKIKQLQCLPSTDAH